MQVLYSCFGIFSVKQGVIIYSDDMEKECCNFSTCVETGLQAQENEGCWRFSSAENFHCCSLFQEEAERGGEGKVNISLSSWKGAVCWKARKRGERESRADGGSAAGGQSVCQSLDG